MRTDVASPPPSGRRGRFGGPVKWAALAVAAALLLQQYVPAWVCAMQACSQMACCGFPDGGEGALVGLGACPTADACREPAATMMAKSGATASEARHDPFHAAAAAYSPLTATLQILSERQARLALVSQHAVRSGLQPDTPVYLRYGRLTL